MAIQPLNPCSRRGPGLAVGHDGAANGTTEASLRLVTPSISVISMGPAIRQAKWNPRGFAALAGAPACLLPHMS